MPGTLERLPAQAARKAGTTSSHHGLYAQGYTRATMGATEGSETARWSESLERHSQFGLGSATRPHEVGIASNRASAMAR
jgi:hypothetical protein